MPSEFSKSICYLKENVEVIYNTIFINFESSEEAVWEEVNNSFIEIKDLINQYNGENPEYDISGNVGVELDTIQFFIDDNNFSNYNPAFDSLILVKDFLVEKCEDFTLYYQELIVEADDLFDSEDYENALTKYQEAIELNPNDSHPQNRIDEINVILSDIEDTYNTLISEADALFDTEDYENAKLKYQEALDLKPSESYPTNRINEIDTILSNQTTYNNLISEADTLFNSQDYENAKIKYQEALDLMPSEDYPSERIDEINTILANQTAYNNLISEADTLFNSQDYENAKIKYQEALDIFPNEVYPSEKIDQINTLLEQNENSEQPKVYSSPFPKRFSVIFPWSTNNFKF